MAHAIIFTGQAPRAPDREGPAAESDHYSYPAGAYKLASHLRKFGLDVLVIPSSLNFTFKGVKRIIEQNSKNLLWVGISTTFLTASTLNFDAYRQIWAASDQDLLSIDILSTVDTLDNGNGITELVWATNELWRISGFLHAKYKVPLLVGGAWVSGVLNGNLNPLHKNCYIITGYGEKFVEEFTISRLKNKAVDVPYIVSNLHYDNNEFKQSTIDWTSNDIIDSTAWFPLEVARGCAFNCAFCTFEHKNSVDLFKDPKILRDELIRNYEVHGIEKYYLIDDLYNDSKHKVRVLYDQVWSRLPFKIEWASFMRLDLLWSDPESAEFIKASGAKIGSFGIETLHDKAGRKVGKGLGRKRIIETLSHLKDVWADDVLIHAFFIAGLPDEPRESIKESMDWSTTTDLLYSAKWDALWITPPSQWTISLEQNINAISKDNDKYGITWIEKNNWINQQGVTYTESKKMCADLLCSSQSSNRITYTDYANLRTAGMTHSELVSLAKVPMSQKKINAVAKHLQEKIDLRLQRVLSITD